jgi:hypothetical protein
MLPSCGSGADEQASQGDSVVIEAPANNILPYWSVDIVSGTMKKDSMANWDDLNADSLISGLNSRNPEILLQKRNRSGDTLFLFIKDAFFLTTELGSSGARQYLSDVVVNLTAVPGINYVSLDFTEGDHASPGVFGKSFVAGFKVIND